MAIFYSNENRNLQMLLNILNSSIFTYINFSIEAQQIPLILLCFIDLNDHKLERINTNETNLLTHVIQIIYWPTPFCKIIPTFLQHCSFSRNLQASCRSVPAAMLAKRRDTPPGLTLRSPGQSMEMINYRLNSSVSSILPESFLQSFHPWRDFRDSNNSQNVATLSIAEPGNFGLGLIVNCAKCERPRVPRGSAPLIVVHSPGRFQPRVLRDWFIITV